MTNTIVKEISYPIGVFLWEIERLPDTEKYLIVASIIISIILLIYFVVIR